MTLDYSLFEWINQGLTNPFFDWLLPVYRDKVTWVPFYLVLAVLMYRNHGWKPTLYLLLCVAIVLGAADQIAASILKPWIGRLRPCAEPEVMDQVRSLVGCGGKYSFPSNHATNHFALAGVLSFTLFRDKRNWKIGLYLWAASICFAQVYVGKHWPGDVLGGGVLGMLLASLGVYLYQKYSGENVIRAWKADQVKSPPSSPSPKP